MSEIVHLEPEAAPASSLPPSAKPKLDPVLLHSPERFCNRELSWLRFNERVLEESKNRRHPLLERLRFLSISASNLDEFYMVRVAGLKAMVNEGVATPSADGLTPEQQIERVDEMAGKLIADQQAVWATLEGELREAGILVLECNELNATDREWLNTHFRE